MSSGQKFNTTTENPLCSSVFSGPPRQIFDRQDPHYSIVRPYPQGAAAAAASFLQNPDKTLVLDVLPPVATPGLKEQ